MIQTLQRALLTLFSIVITSFYAQAAVIYVDADATGSGDGSSWENAFTDLIPAIAESIIGDEVWVAEGSYTPNTTSATDYYSLKNGVGVYGGFSGTELLLEERNVELYTTILDGNINNPESSTDNLLHVVKALNTTLSTRIDGFTIINGRADGSFLPSDIGGGFLNEDGSCTVANCTFLGNYAEYGGAAVANYSSGILNMENCILRSNYSDARGGGIIVRDGTVNISNSDISLNESSGSGGAIRVYEGIINLDRCSISGNIAGGSATIHIDDEGSISCVNSLIVGNVANSSSVVNISLLSNNEPQSFINCTIAHNRNNDSGNVGNSRTMFLNDETDIRNCIVWDNNGVGTGEINSGGTTISHSIVSGGYTISGTQQPNIYQNNPEFVNAASTALAPFFHEDYNYRHALLAFPVDQGVNSFSSDLIADFDGNDRLNGPNVDLGAFENPYCINDEVEIIAEGGLEACEGDTVILFSSVAGEYMWSNNSADSVVVVTQSDEFELVLIDLEGCLGSAEETVTIFPTSIGISGQASFCEGSFTTLTATGNNMNIIWSDGQEGENALVSEEGEITVSAVSELGECPVEASVMVTESPTPSPAIFNTNNELSTGFYDAYQWYLDGVLISGATQNTYDALENGDYYVEVTNASGCSGVSDVITITGIIIDNISELESLVKVTPTLFNNQLFIDNTSGKVVEVNIFNSQGKIVVSQSQILETKVISTSGLASGVYVLLMTSGSESHAIRLVK
ncbi:MAG: T9SS type A sorting domain-containing protein [Flavobacteriales bacterium]